MLSRHFPRSACSGGSRLFSTKTSQLPRSVDVVVVGGGIIGASAAWQLARLGRSVLVLEQNTLTSGATWHALGLLGAVKGHGAMVAMVKYSRDFYRDAIIPGTEHNQVGWAQTGSLGLARSPAMWTQLNRAAQRLKNFGIGHALYGPGAVKPLREARALHPLLDLEGGGVIGALHTPDDGTVNPIDATMHVVQCARDKGVSFVEGCGVAELQSRQLVDGTRVVTGVRTVGGEEVNCSDVLLACGQWTRQIAASIGVNVPVAIVPHQYVVFDKVRPEDGVVTNALPVVRDYDLNYNMKPEVGGFAVGTFEGPHKAMPEEVARRNAGEVLVPATASHELYDDADEKVEDALMNAMGLCPALANCGIKQNVHGPDTHSVDHEPLLGRAPFTDNVWVATGFNSLGIQTGPGVGLALAEWMVHGQPGRTLGADFAGLDVRRFHPKYTSSYSWCTARALEGYAREYGVKFPTEEFSSDERARGMRLSPLHREVTAAGAVFGSIGGSGFERPQHFCSPDAVTGNSTNGAQVFHVEEKLSFAAREAGWWSMVEREHHAAREGVALFDLSSFGKLHVSGADAEAGMDWCTSSAIGQETTPIGKVVYTQLLNEHGNVEADLTIVPLSEDFSLDGCRADAALVEQPRSFYVVTSPATCTRDADHLLRASRLHGLQRLQIEEVTDSWATLALAGPQSRCLIERAFPAVDFSNAAFPPGTAQELGGGVKALRVSLVGELGWELHCPKESAPSLWTALHAAGKQTNVNKGAGLINAGHRALMLSLRLEKCFVHFGHDVSPSDSPIEAGLGWISAAKLKAGTPFLGRDALLARKAEGLKKRLVSFSVKAGQELQETSLWGGEGIYRDGVRVGHLTSGGIGHTVNDGRAIGIGYVNLGGPGRSEEEMKAEVLSGSYALEVANGSVAVDVAWDALYDPRSERLCGEDDSMQCLATAARIHSVHQTPSTASYAA